MTAAVCLLLSCAAPPGSEEFFEREIRPLLAAKCQKCHGPAKQNGGLRLDVKSAAMKGGDSGPAVSPKASDKSLMLQAVRRVGEASPMPPNEKLAPEEVAKLAAWIDAGAYWPETTAPGAIGLGDQKAIRMASEKHWAFRPITVRPAPEVKQTDWPADKLDRFVLARMEAVGAAPARDANRATLLRRATFDMHGLPPTPSEVDDFLADPNPTDIAFARVVERLLAHPRYGERWGRHWLDVARYADTKGYVFTEERRYPYSYTYRDWVVKSLNDDLPYDRFVKEQLAADKLPTAAGDNSHLAAMGFLTVGRRFLQDVNEITDDRIDVTTRGLLGLTVSCARCHDHKYDAVPAADYYSLYGVFMSSEEPKDLPVLGSPGDLDKRRDFEKQLAAKQKIVNDYNAEQAKISTDRLRADAAKYFAVGLAVEWKPNQPRARDLCRQAGIPAGAFNAWLASWNAAVEASKRKPDFVIDVWRTVVALPEKEFADKAKAAFAKFQAGKDRPLPASLAEVVKTPPAAKADFLKKFGEALAKATKDGKPAPEWNAAVAAFAIPADKSQVFFDRKQREQFKKLERAVEELKVKHPGAEARAMVMVDKPRPMDPHVFLRGNPGRPGPRVPRQFLSVLASPTSKPFAKDGSGRLELANAIVDPKNPLTARVIANRVWTWHFGVGLVQSASDFGLRSEPPTHPELLDDLAGELIASGWSLKGLHRRILNSHTYRQASTATPAGLERDPDNKSYSRFPRRRLEWEPLRDAMLFAAGKLSDKVGGRPEPLFPAPEVGRRTLYGFVDRQNLDGAFRTFDFASPDATSPKRFQTSVPQQSLFLMNAPQTFQAAQGLADRTAGLGKVQRFDAMYRYALGRKPSADEQEAVAAFLAAEESSKNGDRAWTNLAQALLMSNEFSFVD